MDQQERHRSWCRATIGARRVRPADRGRRAVQSVRTCRVVRCRGTRRMSARAVATGRRACRAVAQAQPDAGFDLDFDDFGDLGVVHMYELRGKPP
ncbi:hypothetical protein Cci01nite_36400 [Catellatospora citrea]|uniref:Uncharacterized protein n=1 Tax=Catellatospora citrea TaxID=53366 RepID=A0A8J3P061_9ACTN|nr:hypothetical protein Cci01nite_36400 [Catellatospora citrea]